MTDARYLSEAVDDIDAIYSGYEADLLGLGDRFLVSLNRTVTLIEANPFLYGKVSRTIRAAPLKRFPQIVYYREHAGAVLVVAVRHGRDDPTIWQRRI